MTICRTRRVSFADLTVGLRKPDPADPPAQPAKFTAESLAQVPDDVSNLSAYLQRHEKAEDIGMGCATNCDKGSTAKNLETWDAHWKALSEK